MKRWLFREPPAGSPPRGLARELSISPLLLDILWRRGLDSPEELDAYLSARLPDLVPPSRWPQFPQAAEVISKALLDGKKLAVWGDYDVDGITSSTLVLDVLEAHGLEALWHVPDRRSEGYGLNIPAIEELAAQGCGILLTVDCGISDMAAVARARELGMTVVISDHHLPPPELPPADAICNPRLGPEDDMPCPHLAGVGVAFFLMAAVNAALAPHTGRRFKMDKVLDLVALGTLADVMRLGGQNRILVRGGLDKLAEAARPGIAALKTVSGSDAAARLNAGQVVFRLAPRINAAGRMGAADTALQLLRSKDHVEALRLAQHLDALNTQRREEEERIWAAAREQAHRQLEQRQRPALVLYGGDWHPGIVGIVASRIVEEFYRPTIILCDDNNMMKGSGRSIREFDLYAGLQKTAHVLAGFGGHKLAAGVRLEPNQLERFREAFERVVADELGEQPLTPALLLECELDFQQASDSAFLQELELMQPFGAGNAEPVFASPELTVVDRSPLGYSGDNVRLRLKDSASGITLMAKGWNMATAFPPSSVGSRIRVAYTPRLDYYRGVASIDVGIKDWQPVAD